MKLILTVALFLCTCLPCSAEMLSVSVRTADIYSSPTRAGAIVQLEAPLYYPLLAKESRDDFVRVTDFLGRNGWINKTAVSNTETVVVSADVANLRQGPGTNHPVVFKAEQGVAFKVISRQGSWLAVIHEGGEKGWIYSSLVWGATNEK